MKPLRMENDRLTEAFDREASAALTAAKTAPGRAHLAKADASLAALKSASLPPAECGPDIPMAPARGEMKAFRPIELVPGSVGMARDTGHWERGEDSRRRAARIKDVFDRMEDQARAAHKAKCDKSGEATPFLPPLTPAQVQIARDYRDLSERHAAGGMKCTSLETASRGSGGQGGEFIDAYVAEGLRLAALHRRIGTGVAMAVRRIRPSGRGGRTASLITDRALVDKVCLGDCDLGQVLKAQGWSVQTAPLGALRKALAAALDRMQGYDLPPRTK